MGAEGKFENQLAPSHDPERLEALVKTGPTLIPSPGVNSNPVPPNAGAKAKVRLHV